MTTQNLSSVPSVITPKVSPRQAIRKCKQLADYENILKARQLNTNNARLSLVTAQIQERIEATLPDEELSSDLTEVEDTDSELPEPTRDLIYSVYEDVWRDFYDWEHQYCHKVLQLVDAESGVNQPPAQIVDVGEDLAFEYDAGVALRASTFNESVQVLEFSNGEPVESTRTSYTVFAPIIEPYESYESCSPTSRSIFVGDDSDEMPFVPFADDPSFDIVDYQEQFKTFAWEKGNNSDCRFIS